MQSDWISSPINLISEVLRDLDSDWSIFRAAVLEAAPQSSNRKAPGANLEVMLEPSGHRSEGWCQVRLQQLVIFVGNQSIHFFLD